MWQKTHCTLSDKILSVLWDTREANHKWANTTRFHFGEVSKLVRRRSREYSGGGQGQGDGRGNGTCLLFPGCRGSVGRDEEGLEIGGHFLSHSCIASMSPKSLCWPLSLVLETLLRRLVACLGMKDQRPLWKVSVQTGPLGPLCRPQGGDLPIYWEQQVWDPRVSLLGQSCP